MAVDYCSAAVNIFLFWTSNIANFVARSATLPLLLCYEAIVVGLLALIVVFHIFQNLDTITCNATAACNIVAIALVMLAFWCCCHLVDCFLFLFINLACLAVWHVLLQSHCHCCSFALTNSHLLHSNTVSNVTAAASWCCFCQPITRKMPGRCLLLGVMVVGAVA